MVVSCRRLALALAIVAVLAALGLAAPARATTTVLYDGAVSGQKLSDQGYFSYATSQSPSASTTTLYQNGGTTLRSTTADSSGYYTPISRLPALSRTAGYTLTFTAQVVSEAHENNNRSGFSTLVLGDDSWGIEVVFWQGEIWVQNDGTNDPAAGTIRWTHGEGAAYNTAAGLVTYSVVIKGNTYRVLANGTQILTGPVRKYVVTQQDLAENLLRAVYTIPNLIFLGDNTSAAGAEARITRVELDRATAGAYPVSLAFGLALNIADNQAA